MTNRQLVLHKRAIRGWLGTHGRTQTWLAAKVGVSSAYLSDILNGGAPIPASFAARIYKVTGVALLPTVGTAMPDAVPHV